MRLLNCGHCKREILYPLESEPQLRLALLRKLPYKGVMSACPRISVSVAAVDIIVLLKSVVEASEITCNALLLAS